jgi:hypothetical protein
MTRGSWQRATSYGIAWGVAVAGMESLELPLGDLNAGEVLVFIAKLLPHLCVAGIVLVAVTLQWAERTSVGWQVLWAAVIFPLVTCTTNLLTRDFMPKQPHWATDGGESYLHVYWTSLLYGSLFLVAFHLWLRHERTRRRLARTEILRQQSESTLAASRMEALRGHVDPVFLLRVVAAVRDRYPPDPAGADRLLERLVDFLRAAMPGIRSGGSTVAAEADLAQRYGELLQELDGGPHVRVAMPQPMRDIPFPPLLMLPVLDQLAAAAAGADIQLTVAQNDDQCSLTLHSTDLQRPGWLSSELAFRLQVGLRTLFGEGWRLRLSADPGTPAFVLTLPLQRTAPVSSTTIKEVMYA